MADQTTKERFWGKVHFLPCGGCWEWIASTNNKGYGQFWSEGRMVRAHRWSYEATVGPIPSGLVIDHLCRNRLCVNPSHMEPVTVQENNRRGGKSWALSGGTQCAKGHLLANPEAIYIKPSTGERQCRTCNKVRSKEWRRKNAGRPIQ